MAESFYLKNQANNEKAMGRAKSSRERTLLRVLKRFLSRVSQIPFLISFPFQKAVMLNLWQRLNRLHLKPWIPSHYLCYKHFLCCSTAWALKATGWSQSWKTGFEVAQTTTQYRTSQRRTRTPRGIKAHEGGAGFGLQRHVVDPKFGFTAFSAIPEDFHYSTRNIRDYANPSHLTVFLQAVSNFSSLSDTSSPHSGYDPCLNLQLPSEVWGLASAPAPWSTWWSQQPWAKLSDSPGRPR